MKKNILFSFLLFNLFCLAAQEIKGTYAIKNLQTGLLLRPQDANHADGTPIILYDQQNWKCMTWDFKLVDEKTYQLKNLFTGKTFQPVHLPVKNNTSLYQQLLTEKSAIQFWEFIQVRKNIYRIRLKGTPFYLTAQPEKSNIVLKPLEENDLQYWTLIEQHPTM